ncbi:MAG: tandem-95 repeat protein [Candidatus Sulfotelmatobacter sp.]|nr:tandem-95 repeat protein [Candidatus Sulfotelmatobacter sp.]
MGAVFPRVIVKWMCVPSVLLAFLAFENLSFAQSRFVSGDKPAPRHSLSKRKVILAPAPAHLSAKSSSQPPNTSDSWTGGGDGTSWNNAANWSAGVPNSSTVDVTIGTTTAAVSDNLVNAQIANLTLSHAGDSLTINNGIALDVFGPSISNAGTITVGSAGFGTDLVLEGNVTLSGAGTLTLTNNTSNFIFGAASADTLTNQSTIQGAGHIGNGSMGLVNSGTINANQSNTLFVQANGTGGGATNTGTMEATAGGTLQLLNATFANAGGTISANGSTLQVNGSTVNGGAVTLIGASTLQLNTGTIHGGSTLTNSATGTIEAASGGSTLGGSINNSAGGLLKIDNGALLNLETGTYSLGTVQLNSAGFGTTLELQGNVTLNGGTTVTMSNNTNNFIFGSTSANTLTNQGTIQGAGHIGNGTMGLVNSGTINANQPSTLFIQANGTGGGATNTGTMEATAGGTLQLVNTTFANTGGTISANASTLQVNGSTINGGAVTLTGASTLQLNTGTIHGGSTLTNSATGTIEAATGGSTLGGSINNSAGGLLKIDNGALLNLETGTYSQLGAVQLNSAGFGTSLELQGNVTLSGGTVTMSNNTNNFIFGASSANTLTNQGTIQGAGHIGNGTMGLVNSGTINANQPSTLFIQANGTGGGATNTGTMEATAGGTLQLLNTTFANTGGTISANASTLQVNGATINGGAVTLTGASTLQLNTGTIHGGSTLTNSATGTIEVATGGNTLGGTINNSAGGTFKIDNGALLNLETGTYSQLGAVQLNSAGFGTSLELQGNVTLSGGTVTMSNNTNNFIFGSSSANTLTNQGTIQGAGHVGNGSMGLVNSGTINANQTAGMTIQDGAAVTATNTGTLEATAGSTLTLANTTFTNTGGTVAANASTVNVSGSIINGGNVTLTGASTLLLNTGTIHGGSTLTNSATGTIEVATGGNTLGGTINNSAGGTFKVDNGALLNLETGTYSQLGAVQLNSAGFGTSLELQGNVTLSGGTVTMSNNTSNFISGVISANTLTNQETIQGAGHIGNGSMGLVNSGTINANQPSLLTIQANGTGSGATNTGTLEATAGGTLQLLNTTFANTGGTISANASTVQVTGSTINGGAVTLTGASTLQLNTGTIHGGSTLTNSATGTIEVATGGNTLGGTINNSAGGTFKIDNGAVLNLETGTYSQLGAVQLNSAGFGTSLELQGNVTLSGGTVTMSNNTNNFIFGASSANTLTNQETIQGAGNIGNGQMTLVNSGTILANASNNLTISVGSGTVNNTGTLDAAGGTLTIQGSGTTFFINDNQTTNTLTGGTYIANGNNIQWAAGSGGIKTLSANVVEEGGGQLINTSTGNTNVLAGLTSITSVGALTIGGVAFSDTGSFSNAGSLTILPGESFTVATLAQISAGSLTAGTYVLDGNLSLSGATQSVTTNAANLTLAGGTIVNADSTNALAALASNTKNLTIAGTSNNVSSTAASFSNTGTLTINGGDSFTTGNLTQLTGTNSNKTLSAGSYVLAGNLDLTTSGISITKNSATLTLEGGTINSGGSNALAALAANTKTLTIAGTGTNVVTTAASFSNTGALTINSGDSFTAPALTQISGGTLTGGTYVLGGNLNLTSAATVTANAAKLTLQGGTIKTGSTNDLASLNTNTGSLTLASNANFATAGSFTNSGTLTVNKGSKFSVTTGTLTNLSGGTLANGTFVIGGTVQLPSANGGIVTNAANLTLSGTAAKILDGTANALAGFNNNTGTFALSTGAAFTAASSTFTNTGTVTVAKGTTLTVPGTGSSYSQSAGQTTIDGSLAGISGGANFTGGTILGAGSVKGTLSVGNASGNTATINVGDNAKAGLLSITGTYTQLATGTMTGLINGTTVGSGFSQLQVTGTAALAGTINFTVATAFQPSLTVGETFTALTASSVTGTFSNSTIAINSSFHFVVSYTSTGVVLTVASGPTAPSGHSSALLASRAAIVNTRQTVGFAKRPIPISGLRSATSSLVKMSKPFLVIGLRPPAGRSAAIMERPWERNSFRTAQPTPVLSGMSRIPEKPIRTVATASAPRPTFTASSRVGGMKPSANVIRTFAGRLAPVTNRSAMTPRMLHTRLPMTRLGR